ncbi:hypothetical protein BN193_08150 [Lactococcus raffinolactis 4877]|nr:hypothetical protein BN193_08150 [Lactococcus raffinolactis 4877]
MNQFATWFKHFARVVGGVWFDSQEIHHTFFADVISMTVVTD